MFRNIRFITPPHGKNINKVNDNSKIYNHPYVNSESADNSIIPLKLFQTWRTKNLPLGMQNCVNDLKMKNPEFEYFLFDDDDCRHFIEANFGKEVLNAYNCLMPGAYKADLWRLCVLFVHGGIYMDIKLTTINNFKLIELTQDEHLVKDRPPNTIYNALMVCRQHNPFLLLAIKHIVANVKNRYYGKDALEPTGPILLGKIMHHYKLNVNTDMKHWINGGYIIYKNTFVISTAYPEYPNEKLSSTKSYRDLWNQKKIYA